MNPTHCTDCQCELPILPIGHVGGTGYATLPAENNRPVCYACADKRSVEALKDRTRPFVAYVKMKDKSGQPLGVGDGLITSWTGGKLMTIVDARPCKLTRRSWTHDRNGYMSIRAIDTHGQYWTGRGSDGIAIKLRAVKG